MPMVRLLPALMLLTACARASTAPPPGVGYGTVMADIARRFELLGRAAAAGRYELADYQLGELVEVFSESLPRADLPKEGHPEVLPNLVRSYLETTLPDLRRAIATHDPAQLTPAFERAARACNACHQASGHGFIEVPVVAGQAIPDTTPLSR